MLTLLRSGGAVSWFMYSRVLPLRDGLYIVLGDTLPFLDWFARGTLPQGGLPNSIEAYEMRH